MSEKPIDPAKIIVQHCVPHLCIGARGDALKPWKIGDPPCLPDQLAVEMIRQERRIAELEARERRTEKALAECREREQRAWDGAYDPDDDKPVT